MRRFADVIAVVSLAMGQAAVAQLYGPGVTDTEIKIGNTSSVTDG